MPGFPSCFLDRADMCSPYNNVRRYFRSIQKNPGHVGLTATAHLDTSTADVALAIDVISDADLSADGMRLQAVLLEDSIHGRQYNGFAGGQSGWFYGWEQLEQYVEINFDDVARGVYPSFYGQPVTTTMWSAMQHYTQEMHFTLPATVADVSNLHVVAILLNTEGHIVNAYDAPVHTETSAISAADCHRSIALQGQDVVADAGTILNVSDAQGRLLRRSAIGRLSLRGLKGLVVVEARQGNKTETLKIIL